MKIKNISLQWYRLTATLSVLSSMVSTSTVCLESVAASISITNVMNFQTTSAGTDKMFAKERKSRTRWFDKISKGCYNIAEDFFAEEDK